MSRQSRLPQAHVRFYHRLQQQLVYDEEEMSVALEPAAPLPIHN